MRKIAITLLLLTLPAQTAFADAQPGNRIITLGADLTPQEKASILTEFKHSDKDTMIVVSYQDEVHYFPDTKLTGRELSSCLITIKNKGEGISVTKSPNIIQVSGEMYENALLTAGVQDADIYVTAPEPVTGTAALTGIFKAFESATGNKLNENRVQAAGDEVQKTSELGKELGNQQLAADFVRRLKEEIQKSNPQTDADYRKIIEQIAQQMGIQLTPEQVQSLIDLLKKLNSLHIDWSALGNQIKDIGQTLGQYAKDHPQETNAIVEFFKQVFHAFQQLVQKMFH
ncbi:hypothetical protein DNHGIG_36500 [Collibacillus ludicampi]|uniref:DUF1002 domain-containing protein n=1 Tax=Collibacillus ludicampi TaxID=2771369 RepID=A0AAV4LJS2_9BACL|nr:DUF1002 domain-containing protein [Collibacillus ludicampi]GIM48101.1 hypothetical protein DNHGIG_36500 [Collibacillus ludicampi]